MNDEKILALARYTKHGLRERLGGHVFGWKTTPKRRTNLKPLHKWGQFIVDLLIVAPAAVAIAVYLSLTPTPTTGLIGVIIIEALLTVALCAMMFAHSPITERWDVNPDTWKQSAK